jgi:hypothetical protein
VTLRFGIDPTSGMIGDAATPANGLLRPAGDNVFDALATQGRGATSSAVSNPSWNAAMTESFKGNSRMTVSSDLCSAEADRDSVYHNGDGECLHESRAERESRRGRRFGEDEFAAPREGTTDLTANVLSRLQFEFTNLFGEGRL